MKLIYRLRDRRGDDLLQFFAQTSSSFLRPKSSWKTRHILLTSFSKTKPLVFSLHSFRSSQSAETEISRLELTRNSIVCVPPDGHGKMFSIKITGLAPREKDEKGRWVEKRREESWVIACDTADGLKNWMGKLKEIVAELASKEEEVAGRESEITRLSGRTTSGGNDVAFNTGSGEVLGLLPAFEPTPTTGSRSLPPPPRPRPKPSLQHQHHEQPSSAGAVAERRVSRMLSQEMADETRGVIGRPPSTSEGASLLSVSKSESSGGSHSTSGMKGGVGAGDISEAEERDEELEGEEDDDFENDHPYRRAMRPTSDSSSSPSSRLLVPGLGSRRGSADEGYGPVSHRHSFLVLGGRRDSDLSSLSSFSSTGHGQLPPRLPPPTSALPSTPPGSTPSRAASVRSNGANSSSSYSKRMSVASNGSSGSGSYGSHGRIVTPSPLPPPTGALPLPPFGVAPFHSADRGRPPISSPPPSSALPPIPTSPGLRPMSGGFMSMSPPRKNLPPSVAAPTSPLPQPPFLGVEIRKGTKFVGTTEVALEVGRGRREIEWAELDGGLGGGVSVMNSHR